MYSDTCGPFSVADVNWDFNFQVYIDDFTRLTETFVMKAKSGTIRNIEIYVPFMTNKFSEV